MFLKNFYIASRVNTNSNYVTLQNGLNVIVPSFESFTNTPLRNIKLLNGEFIQDLINDYNLTSSSFGFSTQNGSDFPGGYTLNNQQISSNALKSNFQHTVEIPIAYSSGAITDIPLMANILLGEGDNNTTVNYADYQIDNPLDSTKISLTASRGFNGYNISVTNISDSNISIKQLGYTFSVNVNSSDVLAHLKADTTYNNLTSISYTTYEKFSIPFLVVKTILTIPITLVPNETKEFQWNFTIPEETIS